LARTIVLAATAVVPPLDSPGSLRSPATGQATAGLPAQDVAAAVQKKYDTVKDFTADFVQESEGGLLRRKQVERGVVQVKKPGKMRWDYKSPEPKLFISDGRRIYLYVPADNQVVVSPFPSEDQATTAVLFLVGKGNLTRDFNVSYADPGSASADTYALRLQPKVAETDYDWLQVVIDRKTLQIRTLTAADRDGGRSTFQFTNFKENSGLSDKTFAFKIPRGADVTTNGTSAK
jgi:outer membrane lipoprotein carrier protein